MSTTTDETTPQTDDRKLCRAWWDAYHAARQGFDLGATADEDERAGWQRGYEDRTATGPAAELVKKRDAFREACRRERALLAGNFTSPTPEAQQTDAA